MSETVDILLVEDDTFQSRLLAEQILDICDANGIDAEVSRYFSEHSFLEALRTNDFPPPKFAIIDLMLHYYSPNDLEEIPQESETTGHAEVKRAGLRCHDELHKKHPSTKILLITVLKGKEIEQIPKTYSVAQKGNHQVNSILTEFLISDNE